MTKLADFIAAMEAIAPPGLAETWDNVGLLVGDRSQKVARAMLTIDYTPAVAEEAQAAGCDLVVAYHPPIFQGHKRVTADAPTSLVFDAIRRGVAIYSPHTALDVADGGTNDVLADALALALVDRRPLRRREPANTHAKLVVFAPVDAADRVADALFEAGAGKLGGYSRVSFRGPGHGTFQGDESTNPAVGEAGKFERTDESRIEMLVPLDGIDRAIAALRKAHPYEEPAFDIYQPIALPSALGIGRVGKLPGAITLEMVANLLKRGIDVDHLLIAGDPDAMISRVALCAGAGGDLLKDAIAQRVDLYVTGELRHHDALAANRAGMSVICTLHSNSERATLARLATRLHAALPAMTFAVSKADRDPFVIA